MTLRRTPRRALWISCSLAFGVPAFITVILAIVFGEQLAFFGHKSHRLIGRLIAFEQHLSSADHAAELTTHYTVCVFGDSTHFYKLPEESWMIPTLAREFASREIDDVAVYGMSFGALTAWDYYLLLNRVAHEKPDLLILPVHLGSFSNAWLTRRAWHFPILHQYLPASEFRHAYGLSVAGRSFHWEQIALQRLDFAVFGGMATPFFGGIRYGWKLVRAGGEQWIGNAAMANWPALSDANEQPPTWQQIDTHIPETHDLFGAFDLINRLAAERGIPILYYTAQLNVKSYAQLGIELHLQENYRRIARRLETGPGITVLNLAAENPEEVFADESFHYNELGISRAAAQLVDAAIEIRAGRSH